MLQALTAASCACVLIELPPCRRWPLKRCRRALVGSWLAEDIGGRGVIDDLQTTLEIREDGTYGGMAGCNHFTGTFGLSGRDDHLRAGCRHPQDVRTGCHGPGAEVLRSAEERSLLANRGIQALSRRAKREEVLQLTSMQSRNGNHAELTIEIPDAGAVDRRTVRYACGDKTIEAEYIDAGSASLATFISRARSSWHRT